MTKRVVEHEIKLEKSVKIILGVLALGVLLNALATAFDVREAFAEWDALDNKVLNKIMVFLGKELGGIQGQLYEIAQAIKTHY
jgi:hypothetical protein